MRPLPFSLILSIRECDCYFWNTLSHTSPPCLMDSSEFLRLCQYGDEEGLQPAFATLWVLFCLFVFPPLYLPLPSLPFPPLSLDRREIRMWGGGQGEKEILESKFFLSIFFFFEHNYQQTANSPTSWVPSIYIPSEKLLHITQSQKLYSWQNHTTARAQGKSQSTAGDSPEQTISHTWD